VQATKRNRHLSHVVLPLMPCVRRNPFKANVLVVDDSPEIQRYLRALLELDSYQVETVSSGAEALRSVSQGCAPEVVLLDVQMPEMDGLETLRQLQKFRPTPKVIMCSGTDDPDKIQDALSLGADSYQLKPIQHLYLSAAVERCLNEDPTQSPAGRLGSQLFLLPSPSSL